MKPENATIKHAKVSKAPFENIIGTLRSDNGAGVRENLAEKYTPHLFKSFRNYHNSPSYLKEGNLCWS